MMKAKIYQFPQGEEKAQVKAEIARIKNAPVVEKRKRWLWSFFLTLFFVLRLVVAFIADMALTLAVVVCHGVIYLSIILGTFFLILKYNVPFYFGGTSLLIIVVVTMDFMAQVQNYLMTQQYDALLKKANFKSR